LALSQANLLKSRINCHCFSPVLADNAWFAFHNDW